MVQREQGSAILIGGWGRGMKTRFSVNQGCQKSALLMLAVSIEVEPLNEGMGPLRAAQAPRRWCSQEEPEIKRKGPEPYPSVVADGWFCPHSRGKGREPIVHPLVALRLGGSVPPGVRQSEGGAARALKEL